MDFGIAGYAGITVICYLAGMIVKVSFIDNKWIPVVCGILGIILGIVALHIVPDFPAQNYISAAGVGVVSGLAATGVNQLKKQLLED